MLDIKSYSYEELETFIIQLGQPKYRTKQLFDWLHNKAVMDFDEMLNLSKDFREQLKKTAVIKSLKLVNLLISEDQNTKKYLFELDDGNVIESVLMRYQYGYSICISSQVGCKMGCKFCASTLNGLDRNLTVSELLEQIYAVERIEKEACHSVVVMGIGEPFDNYENMIQWIRLINDDRGRNLGQRHIAVSTCGIIPKIREFADLNTQVNLAISLHGINNEKRSALMPINDKYPIEDLLDACRYYIKKTNRRITFEYTVIEGANESVSDAKALCRLLKGMLCHVNLIPININVNESLDTSRDFEKPSMNTVQAFRTILEEANISVTIRRSLGDDINASCGQLKYQHKMDKGEN